MTILIEFQEALQTALTEYEAEKQSSDRNISNQRAADVTKFK